MEYYCLRVLLKANQYFLIWRGNSDKGEENDQILTSTDGLIIKGETYQEISKYAHNFDIELRGEPTTYDLVRVSNWVENRVHLALDELLDAWNIFLDISASISCKENSFLAFSDSLMPLHEALSLLSITRLLRKEKTTPEFNSARLQSEFNSAELQSLKELMQLGLDLIQKSLDAAVFGSQ